MFRRAAAQQQMFRFARALVKRGALAPRFAVTCSVYSFCFVGLMSGAGHPVHNSFLILLVPTLLNLRRHPSLFLPTARMNQKIVRSFPSSLCFVGRVSERLDV